ncbi:MAG: FIST N-terminal domain-containing protein [Chloroflexota bacterium]
MTLKAAVGLAQVMDGREAGMQAAHHALNDLGQHQGNFSGSMLPSLCLVIVPHRYDPQQVISGVASMLAYQPGLSSDNLPIIGLSVSAGLSQTGAHAHSVIVAILTGDNLQAETHWFPDYSHSSAETAAQIVQISTQREQPPQQVLVFADGFQSDTDEFCRQLPPGLPVVGGLASGDLLSTNSFQISGMNSGSTGLTAAFLRGNIKIGAGSSHGWHAVGSSVCITNTHDFSIKTLNDRPVSEIFSELFGKTTAEWTSHPLNALSRIYPLGLEQNTSQELLLRAPLHMQTDGSLRMGSRLVQGQTAYPMIGSPANCRQAAQQAAQQALLNLGSTKPVFALVLVDTAWQILLQAHPGQEIQAIQEVLGNEIPIAGGYTSGQIAPPTHPGDRSSLLNQHILVLLFGEPDKPE